MSPASSFDLNDFTAEAIDPNYQFMGTTGYANPFLMPDVPMDLDAFTQNIWVCYKRAELVDCLTNATTRAASLLSFNHRKASSLRTKDA